MNVGTRSRGAKDPRPVAHEHRQRWVRRRGIALVLVLWILVILGAVGATIAVNTRTATGVASNARARVIARYAAESAIEAVVAAVEDSLRVADGDAGRQGVLNTVEFVYNGSDSLALGDGRAAATVVDVSARLDVNTATQEQLARFFSYFTDPVLAGDIARAIRYRIERGGDARDPAQMIPDASGGFRPVRPLRSLDELRELDVASDDVYSRAATYLTVDGDGTINRRTASDTVLGVAGGELRDEPSRLLVIARGWQAGHPLTVEVQQVFGISNTGLVRLSRRERGL